MLTIDGKKKAIICDLDGTLCDITHRIELFHQKKFKEFECLIPNDTANIMVGHFLNYMRYRGYLILFVSGRSEDTRIQTHNWLADNFPGFEKFPLFLRGRKDFRHDYEVKREIYVNQIQSEYEVSVVLDDRQKVVDEWRSLGLQCWQVAEGQY